MGRMNLLYVTPRQLLKVMINLHERVGWQPRGRGKEAWSWSSIYGPQEMEADCVGRSGVFKRVQLGAKWNNQKTSSRGHEADSREPSSGLRIYSRKSENTDSQVKVCRSPEPKL